MVGLAFNPTVQGVAHSLDCAALMRRAAEAELFVQVQVEQDQMAQLAPTLLNSGARLLIDHCGRPTPDAGLQQSGFQAVLGLARSGRAAVKLSGYQKFSTQGLPHADAQPFVGEQIEAYGLDACLWGSDWPYLKSPHRLDIGPLLRMVERWLPKAADRRHLLWDTPCRLFGFGDRSVN